MALDDTLEQNYLNKDIQILCSYFWIVGGYVAELVYGSVFLTFFL